MKGTFIHAALKSKWRRALKNWHWHDFQAQHLFVKYARLFTTLWQPNVVKFITFFQCFNSNIDLTPLVPKKGTSNYKIKVKIIVNMRGHILEPYWVRLLKAAPFAKIVQSFILMQNFQKRNWIGEIKFLVNLANIKHCPKFLEDALHALICSKKLYICKWTKMKCCKVEALGCYKSFSVRMNPCTFL